jgi:hypothetical protein
MDERKVTECEDLVYKLSEHHREIKVDFTRFGEGYSCFVKYKDDLLYEYNGRENKSINHLPEIVKHYSFSKRCYYFQDLYSNTAAFFDGMKERESEINKITQNYYPFFAAAVYYYLGFLLRGLNEDSTIKFQVANESSNINQPEGSEILRANIHNLTLLYPNFSNDYDLLVKNFITPQEDGSLKIKDDVSKHFLAEYFSSIKPEDGKNMKWQLIEKIFNEKILLRVLVLMVTLAKVNLETLIDGLKLNLRLQIHN